MRACQGPGITTITSLVLFLQLLLLLYYFFSTFSNVTTTLFITFIIKLAITFNIIINLFILVLHYQLLLRGDRNNSQEFFGYYELETRGWNGEVRINPQNVHCMLFA